MNNSETAELFATGIHPRILFGPPDAPRLREKIKSGIPGRAMAEITRRCQCCRDPADAKFVQINADGEYLKGDASAALHCLGFAYALSGDESLAREGIAIIKALAKPRTSDKNKKAASGALGGELPLAYDLFYSVMNAEDRNQVATYLRDGVIRPYQEAILKKPVWGLGVNTFIWHFPPYVLALAAVFEPDKDTDAMRQCASLARRSLHLGVDDGGAIGEGPSYGWCDAMALTMVALILRRAGIADLWEEEPRFREMLRHWAYLILPGQRGQNTIGDAWRFAGGERPWWPQLILARQTGDPVLQWIWEQMAGRGPHKVLGNAPERFEKIGYAALWEDDDALSRTPGQEGWPLAKTSGDYGVTVMRSGWDDDDLYFSLLAAGRAPGCYIHQHVDAGHFCLFAMNEAFSIDTGYGDSAGCYHSVMMPAGREPPSAPKDFDAEDYGGRTEAFAAEPAASYGRVNIGHQWDCHWNYRHALMVAAPGADPYLILLDNVNYRDGYCHYEWLINSEPGNRIETDNEAARAVIHGAEHRLEIAWAYPGADDYPQPHRIELGHDIIDSFPIGHRNCDVNYFFGTAGKQRPMGGARWGAGNRPRLKAMLWGFNGMLLSALVPRRKNSATIQTERIAAVGHFGLIVRHGETTDTIVAAPVDRYLDLAGIRGEATLAMTRRNANGDLVWWAAADAYELSIGGTDVMPRRGRLATLVCGG